MADLPLRLRLDGVPVAGYADGGDLDPKRWITDRGEVLLTAHRTVRARPVPYGWELEIGTTLTNATDRPVRLGSPATNGRAGAATTRALRALVADGVLDDGAVRAWAEGP